MYVTVSVFTVSALIFLTLTPKMRILYTAIPQHIISPIHWIGCTALLKKLFPNTSGEMLCHAINVHTLQITHVLYYSLAT
jgi:hypothetical protein